MRSGRDGQMATLQTVTSPELPWPELEQQVHAALGSAIEREPLRQAPRFPGQEQRVFAVTDIHVDKDANAEWLRQLSRRGDFINDVLIVCGDVADEITVLSDALEILASTFGTVFFMPGNHDLWVRGRERLHFSNSIEKLIHVLQLCESLGIKLGPAQVGDVWISPVWSWHHSSFDKEPDLDLKTAAYTRYIKDYTACKFPPDMPGSKEPGSVELAGWFDELNSLSLSRLSDRQPHEPLITFSHFLPLQALLPEKRFLYLQCLAKASGSDPLAERVQSLSPDMHLFGHTHFSWDQRIDGIRYVQAPLCYPKERELRLPSLAFDLSRHETLAPGEAEAATWVPVELYRSSPTAVSTSRGTGKFVPPMSASWSNYYRTYDRDPTNVDPAPWVAKRIARRRAAAGSALRQS